MGSVGGAAALALAAVLAGVLTAALALTVVLTLARVLGQGFVLNKHDTGMRRGSRGSSGCIGGCLGIQASAGAAHYACHCGGERESLDGLVVHGG